MAASATFSLIKWRASSKVCAHISHAADSIIRYPHTGFGAAIGSGAYAPGLQAGGSSTRGSTQGALLGKGAATLTKKVKDEELRKRLETYHVFQELIEH